MSVTASICSKETLEQLISATFAPNPHAGFVLPPPPLHPPGDKDTDKENRALQMIWKRRQQGICWISNPPPPPSDKWLSPSSKAPSNGNVLSIVRSVEVTQRLLSFQKSQEVSAVTSCARPNRTEPSQPLCLLLLNKHRGESTPGEFTFKPKVIRLTSKATREKEKKRH